MLQIGYSMDEQLVTKMLQIVSSKVQIYENNLSRKCCKLLRVWGVLQAGGVAVLF